MITIIIISLSGWIVGTLLGIIGIFYGLKNKDKDMFYKSFQIFALFLLTGYITFYPILIASLIDYRLNNN